MPNFDSSFAQRQTTHLFVKSALLNHEHLLYERLLNIKRRAEPRGVVEVSNIITPCL